MKRILIVASIALVLLSTACTREKPPVTEPTPGVAVVQGTPGQTTPVPGSGAASPTVVVVPTIPAGGPGQATEQPSVVVPPVPTNTPVASTAVPTTAPIPTVVPPVAPPEPGGSVARPGQYTVQRGDWFYAIARKFNVSVAQLQAANPQVDPRVVYPGQVLNIPSPGAPDGSPPPAPGGRQTYTVRRGDTLFSIAVRFHTNVLTLQQVNNLPNPHVIFVGQRLIIP